MIWNIADYNNWIRLGGKINNEVTILDISNANMISFVGIENLPNLIELNCSENDVTSLIGIEKLEKLKNVSYVSSPSCNSIDSCIWGCYN